MTSAAANRKDRLYLTLPAVHRARDAERGEPLRALLQIIGDQFDVIEDDITGLYENWFIETCADWVVPYIGDLVGWRALADTGLNHGMSPRRDVANTIRNRRRKGSLALLEELAFDVANWPARAVEFVRLLAATPALDHPSTLGRALVDVRAMDALDRLGGPFETTAHTVDVRRIQSSYAPGRYNTSSVGLFVFRLRAQSVSHAQAYCLEEVGPEWFTFSALGNDSPLFSRPEPELSASSIAGEANVPSPMRRRALLQNLASTSAASAAYGVVPGTQIGRSFAIWAEDWPHKGVDNTQPIARERILAADLSDFQYTAPRNYVAVDPELGRIVFPTKQLPKKGVWVSYHYGFSADMGGGEYTRPLSQPERATLIRVQGHEEFRHALQLWHGRRHDDDKDSTAPEQPEHAVIEIADSGVYVLPIGVTLAAGHSLQIRAAQHARPVIRLLDWQTDRPDSLGVSGGRGSRFVLDGVLVAGRGMRIDGELASVTLRHCTLVPGWTLAPNCDPRRPAEPSIEIVSSSACLVIQHSIVGSIQVNVDEVAFDPLRIRVSDSIVDATGSDCEGTECEAIGAAGTERAHASLQIARSTVIGRVLVHAIALAEDTIFTGRVSVARRQIGCMRFCSVTPCSRTPRRFHCLPDEAERALLERRATAGRSTVASDPDVIAAIEQERQRVRPLFTSARYGTSGYCQLAQDGPPEIARGAASQSEMGAFHDLYQPQRAANLSARLEEYVPAAADVSLIFVT